MSRLKMSKPSSKKAKRPKKRPSLRRAERHTLILRTADELLRMYEPDIRRCYRKCQDLSGVPDAVMVLTLSTHPQLGDGSRCPCCNEPNAIWFGLVERDVPAGLLMAPLAGAIRVVVDLPIIGVSHHLIRAEGPTPTVDATSTLN